MPMSATVTRPAKGVTLRLDAIEIPSTTRPYNASSVVDLKQSIAAIGLQSAPTVIERDGRYLLVAGRHRLEALKLLGVESVLVRVVDFDDVEARMWTISENLHRAELTVSAAVAADGRICGTDKRETGGGKSFGQVAPKADQRHRREGQKWRTPYRPRTRRDPRGAPPRQDHRRPAGGDLGRCGGFRARRQSVRACSPPLAPRSRKSRLRCWKASPRMAASRQRAGTASNPCATSRTSRPASSRAGSSITTPNDRPHVIRVLAEAAAILQDELEAGR